jgi:hypothetical protein
LKSINKWRITYFEKKKKAKLFYDESIIITNYYLERDATDFGAGDRANKDDGVEEAGEDDDDDDGDKNDDKDADTDNDIGFFLVGHSKPYIL